MPSAARRRVATRRLVLWGLLATAALAAAGFAAWIASLPAVPATAAAPAVAREEMEAMLAALAPPKRRRPLVAVIGINDATETTDYLVPAGILRRADSADVMMLATEPGPVELYPALTVQPDATIAEFDTRHPDGADYVIVPAMSRDDDAAVRVWLEQQARKGATIVGVCAGAKVVGAAGLLDGRRATTHWYYVGEMLRRNPMVRHVPDRRLVVDRGVATTTGITASIPMALTLIEAMAGRARAEAVARDLGVVSWDARHASGAFALTRRFALTVLGNLLAFWNHEELGVALMPGMDEVSLALVVDAWSRTYRSRVVAFAASGEPVATRSGMRIVPGTVAADWPAERLAPAQTGAKPADALDRTLLAIGARHGGRTAEIVALQLEYPWHGTDRRVP